MSIKETSDWLLSLYQRFNEDVKRLNQLEPFWQICNRCPDGHCCGTNSYVSLKSSGNPFLIEEWWLMLEFVRDRFSDKDKKQLALNIISNRAACIFLFKNRCSVHSIRPWGSRIHPYTINFYDKATSFPAGEIALPSCPSMAYAFGLKTNEMLVQRPQIIERADDGTLVRVKLKKHKPVWLIDASRYVMERENRAATRPASSLTRQQLLELAESAGGAYGGLLRIYLEMILGIRTNVRFLPPDDQRSRPNSLPQAGG
jgi:Fe-S-cluster containining protein